MADIETEKNSLITHFYYNIYLKKLWNKIQMKAGINEHVRWIIRQQR